MCSLLRHHILLLNFDFGAISVSLNMKKLEEITFVPSGSIVCLFVIVTFAFGEYNFRHSADEEICRTAKFVDITEYRSASLAEMSWQSAVACCKLRGQILHTIERSDESDENLLNTALRRKSTEPSDYWIGLTHQGNGNFLWTYGTQFTRSYGLMRENYRWNADQPDITHRCAAVRTTPFVGLLKMSTMPCTKELKFICQKVPRNAGRPLSGLDFMVVGSAKFLDIPGFKNLKICKVYGNWFVANALCQSRNWALIDRVYESYGEQLFKSINHKNFMFDDRLRTLHSSGNDLCVTNQWQWVCGERILEKTPQLHNVSSSSGHCIQYLLNSQAGNSEISTVNCDNAEGYIICDTLPQCPVDKQYPCLYKEPQYIDVSEGLQKEIIKCQKAKFYEWDSVSNDKTTYWVSSAKFTWLGARECCKSKGWELPAPKTMDELLQLNENTLSVISELCTNQMRCDGFWTLTTTKGHPVHSPLRFPDGNPLPKFLYSTIRADAFTYPSCGRINNVDLTSGAIKYVHAHCLEKNFIVCEGRRVVGPQGRSMHFSKAVKNSKPEFDKDLFKMALKPPMSTEERSLRLNDAIRDMCRTAHIDQEYTKSCPNSSNHLWPKKISLKNNSSKNFQEMIMVHHQNRQLLHQIVSLAVAPKPPGKQTAHYGLQLLSYASSLYSSLCPIVPTNFISRSFDLFQQLYSASNKAQPILITKSHMKWTLKLLERCNNLIKPVWMRQDYCGERIVALENCTNHICTVSKFEFNADKADILVDIMWKVIELVHGACFPAFSENAWLHHKFAMTLVDLWDTDEIRSRWAHQTEDRKFWVRVLGPRFEEHVINMERCNKITISNAYFHVRLPRATLPSTVRLEGVEYGRKS